ncbi:MAG TPA: pyruvate, water dikinase regulatory protein [Bacillota bacterium]
MSEREPGREGDEGEAAILYVVSDSLGETAELVARATASQFNSGHAVEVRRIPHVDTPEAVRQVIADIRGQRCAVFYTLIMPELRELMARGAAEAGIPAVDVMGPALEALRRILNIDPKLEPGRMHRLDESYFRRVEAVEFAVKYDDGKDPRGLLHADVVLIGVSRTSKTPVSMYLAHRRLKAANVPLVPEIQPPRELFEIDPARIIGLTIQPEQLAVIRRERLRSIGLTAESSYSDPDRIRQELAYAQEIFRRIGCPVIDVTNKAVEETASLVLQILRKGVYRVERQGGS